MTLDDFKSSFLATFSSPDVRNWQHSYFLSLDKEIGQTGSHRYCGKNCLNNKFTVYSPVAQKVYVSAHVHPGRTYVETSCMKNCMSCSTSHIFKASAFTQEWFFQHGSTWLEAVYMKADSTMELELEVDFTRMDITKDFAIAMLSEIEATTITHHDGHESDSYPLYDPPVEEEPEEEEAQGISEEIEGPDGCFGTIEIKPFTAANDTETNAITADHNCESHVLMLDLVMPASEFRQNYWYSTKSYHRIKTWTCFVDPQEAMLCRLYIFAGDNESLTIVMKDSWSEEVSYNTDWFSI